MEAEDSLPPLWDGNGHFDFLSTSDRAIPYFLNNLVNGTLLAFPINSLSKETIDVSKLEVSYCVWLLLDNLSLPHNERISFRMHCISLTLQRSNSLTSLYPIYSRSVPCQGVFGIFF